MVDIVVIQRLVEVFLIRLKMLVARGEGKMFKIKDKINKKDVGLAKDFFEKLKNSCGYENHCFDDYVNTLDEKYLAEWKDARILRSDLMDECFKIFNVKPKDESWCKMKHICLVAMGCQEDGVRLIEDKLVDSIKVFALAHRKCYVIFLGLLEINEKNAHVGSSA